MRFVPAVVTCFAVLNPWRFLVVAEKAFWQNETSSTSTGTQKAAIPFNIKPPLPLGVSSTDTLPVTRATNNAFTTLAAGGTTLLDGVAVYDNTTFRSVCPTAPRTAAQACFTTCTRIAAKCSSAHASWSAADVAWQKSMNDKKYGGTSRVVGVTTIRYSDYLRTSWGYDTTRITYYSTVDILHEFGETKRVYPVTFVTTQGGKETTISTLATQLGIEERTFWHAYASGTGSVISIHTNTAYITTSTKYYSWSFTEPSPSCSPTSWKDCNFSKDCNKCTISGGTVRLLYFPVPATPLINATFGETPATPTTTSSAAIITAKPSTAVFDNTTLTDGTVYISFHSAYANDQCGRPVGSVYPGAILAVNPEKLSSVMMMWGTMYSSNADPFGGGGVASSPYLIASSLNLADLNWPYNWDAYQNQPDCQNGPFQSCSVVIKDQFFPLLKVPDEIRQLDPEWKDCELDWEGLYDPPIAMTPVQNAATPTLPSVGVAETTKAEPESGRNGGVKETGSSVTQSSSANVKTKTEPSSTRGIAVQETQMPPKTSSSSAVHEEGKPTKTGEGAAIPKVTDDNFRPTTTGLSGSIAGGKASPPMVDPSDSSDPTTGNGLATTAEAFIPTTFVYDPQMSEGTGSSAAVSTPSPGDSGKISAPAVSSTINIGGIIWSALGGAVSSTQAHTNAADDAYITESATGIVASLSLSVKNSHAVVNEDTAFLTSASSTWSGVGVSQGVQLGSGPVLATDVPSTTAGQGNWLNPGGGIVVASGTHRTTIDFQSASIPSSQPVTLRVSTASSHAVTYNNTASAADVSQKDCPHWTTCTPESTDTAATEATAASITAGVSRNSIGTAWAVIACVSWMLVSFCS